MCVGVRRTIYMWQPNGLRWYNATIFYPLTHTDIMQYVTIILYISTYTRIYVIMTYVYAYLYLYDSHVFAYLLIKKKRYIQMYNVYNCTPENNSRSEVYHCPLSLQGVLKTRTYTVSFFYHCRICIVHVMYDWLELELIASSFSALFGNQQTFSLTHSVGVQKKIVLI